MADLRVVQNAYRNYKQRKAAAVSCSVCAGRIRGFAEANAAWGSGRRKGEVHGAVFCTCEGGSPALPNDWLLLS